MFMTETLALNSVHVEIEIIARIGKRPPGTNTYKCNHDYCIPHRWVCDGIIDCILSDDEITLIEYVFLGKLACKNASW